MDYVSMGKRIREIRIKKGFTQDKLAAATKLSSAHISNIETAHAKASLPALVDIANALNASLDELVCDSLSSSSSVYTHSLYSLFEECNNVEKKVISETIEALKISLKGSSI